MEQQDKPKCTCSMTQSVLGDGCMACNAEYWIEFMAQQDDDNDE